MENEIKQNYENFLLKEKFNDSQINNKKVKFDLSLILLPNQLIFYLRTSILYKVSLSFLNLSLLRSRLSEPIA